MAPQLREEDIPIDIYYNKLLDWLVDRRHCELKWQQTATAVREKINAAMTDMPPNEEIRELLSGTFINYFHCQRIIALLKESDEGGKNFFGQYSSKRIKDWLDVIASYEKNCLYLAESSHMLIQNVNYEVPALKRQVAKCQQSHRDCVRKEGECTKNAEIVRKSYKTVCKQMGIEGLDVRNELLSLAKDLPNLFQTISSNVKGLSDAFGYYSAFVGFITERSETEQAENDRLCPLLKHVNERGNTTVYEWRYGKVPTAVIEEPDRQITIDAEADGGSGKDSEIDWGIVSSSDTPSTDTIDYGEIMAESDMKNEGDTTEINWGDDDVVDLSDSGAQIDFGIEVTTGKNEGGESSGSSEGDVAIGCDALSVLENPSTRNVFIDELMELQAFLEQRLDEMSLEADILSVHQFQSAPSVVQMQSKQSVMSMLDKVTAVITEMTSVKMQHLYLIKSSPRYVDRLAESLSQKSKLADKMIEQRDTLVQRREEANKLQAELEPRLNLIVAKTKELQVNIANAISKKYKMRRVNIMGEVNMI